MGGNGFGGKMWNAVRPAPHARQITRGIAGDFLILPSSALTRWNDGDWTTAA